MSSFGDELLKSLGEAIAHAEGQGEVIMHAPLEAKQVRKKANLTQKQMAPLFGMSLSGYRKWEQKKRRLSGPAATLLQVMDKEPEAFRRAVLSEA